MAQGDDSTSVPRVLIIDDDDLVVETIATLLRAEGYDVVSATNGEEGLAQIARRAPDLVLCDRVMPGLSGYEVLERLRHERPDLCDLPFVFLTGLADPRDIGATADLRPAAYLTKPIGRAELLRAVARFVGGVPA
jgi:CheY-like chemotaxis protein